MIGCLTETTICVVAKPLVLIIIILAKAAVMLKENSLKVSA